MNDLSRRDFIATVATAAAFVGARSVPGAALDPAQTQGDAPVKTSNLHWLESAPINTCGVTATVPWPRGAISAAATLRVTTKTGNPIPCETWPLAYWPDGSVKWAAIALPSTSAPSDEYQVAPGESVAINIPIRITDSPDRPLEVDTGIVKCVISRTGANLIDSITRGGKKILTSGRLICLRQDQPEPDESGMVTRESFTSEINNAAIENTGSIRTVVKIDGTHKNAAGRSWMPFVARLYFYAGSDQIRMVHTFTVDGDESKDFIKGIGIRFDVPMGDAMQDRHVRLVGDERGLFAEGIRTVTGLRRDAGHKTAAAQLSGKSTGSPNSWNSPVATHLDLIPAWGDFTLSQLSADGFTIRKRTKPGCSWIAAGAGKRSGGAGYIGGVSGGVAFGIRDFWQKHPAQLDIRNAQTDLAQVTMWLWSPDAPAMDMRFYHDGLGQDTYAKQRDGLDITYEDYEPGYTSPYGIARTSELKIQILPATPSREAIVDFADSLRQPPMLVCDPQTYLNAQVFGGIWTLPDRSTPTKSLIEDQLAFYLDRYVKEVDQRSWYGFWDYGDVRHTYDADRHVWRYDVGGFAWDNSELSTDLWLWLSFLRTGRADIYRLAEAMTRHTGEVDVYHIGKFKGLGTRHGVQHWGDSSKQTRISSALFRRPYYFLTADERVGDLMRNQLAECETWLFNDVTRKLGGPPLKTGTRAASRWGALNWGNLASSWLTELERTQSQPVKDRLLASMKSIAQMPLGFFTQHATMNLDTGVVTPLGSEVEYEHLTALFGLPEICAELVRTHGKDVPEFADTWAKYGELYNGTHDQRAKALGITSKSVGFTDVHSRCVAFAAWHRNDIALAKQAWTQWLDGQSVEARTAAMTISRVQGPDTLNPIDEAKMSTNTASQFSLATIENLAFAGDQVETIG